VYEHNCLSRKPHVNAFFIKVCGMCAWVQHAMKCTTYTVLAEQHWHEKKSPKAKAPRKK